MLRSVLGTGLLVIVYRAELSVAAPGGQVGEPEERPPTQIFKAVRIKIDNKTNFKMLNFFQTFIKIFLKSLKIFIKFPKFVQTLTSFSQITIINLI